MRKSYQVTRRKTKRHVRRRHVRQKQHPLQRRWLQKQGARHNGVIYTPYERPWTWKPLNRVYRQRRSQQEKQTKMAEQKRSEAILRNLAQELLTDEECYHFKQAIHHFRVSHSVTSFCQQLKPLINTTQKILLLVELYNRMPKSLQEDFHHLCSLQFPSYDAYLKIFTNGNASNEIPRVIAQESNGKYKIMTRGSERKMMMKFNNQKQKYELHSLPGTSVTSGIYSNASDSDADLDSVDNKENQGQATPVYLKGKKNVHKVFLNRHEDGSLGLGITGGKEFGTNIVINVVEDSGPAASQGLRVGDKVMEVNGHSFHDITHSEAVQVMRSAWNLIILIERPNEKEGSEGAFHQIRELDLVVYPSNTGRLGCVTQRLNNQTLLVTHIEENSSGSKAGLKKGDNITKIDNIPVHTLSEKQIVMLTHAKRINMTLRREGYFTGDDRDIMGEMNGLFTDMTSDGVPPHKQRRMTTDSRSRSAEPRLSSSQYSGHFVIHKERVEPQISRPVERVVSHPEHFVYSTRPPSTPNWVIAPKPRESRYIQRRNIYNRDSHNNSYPLHVRSYSEGRDTGRFIHVPTESRIQSVGASRYVRNRSYPHRTAVSKIHHDDNVIRAIQSGLEKRQRAIRLSLYQMPDPVDYEWEVQ